MALKELPEAVDDKEEFDEIVLKEPKHVVKVGWTRPLG